MLTDTVSVSTKMLEWPEVVRLLQLQVAPDGHRRRSASSAYNAPRVRTAGQARRGFPGRERADAPLRYPATFPASTAAGGSHMRQMLRATLPEFELAYDSQGSGEPVVLVHHGAGADWFAPLCDEPILSSRYRLVRYHRAGYAGSGGFAGQLTFTREASTFRELMHHLTIE